MRLFHAIALLGLVCAAGANPQTCNSPSECKSVPGWSMLQRGFGSAASGAPVEEEEEPAEPAGLAETSKLAVQQLEEEMGKLTGSMSPTANLAAGLHASHASGVHTEGDSLPFAVPFNTKRYHGFISATVTAGGTTTGAVAYYRVDAKNIYIGMASNSGYVGFGMNRKGPAMRDSDIVVCREFSSGSVSAADYHAPMNAAPQLDAVQHWVTVKGGRDTSGARPVTWCEVSRERKTCETAEDLQLDEDVTSATYGLLAWSKADATSDWLSYHGSNRKAVIFQFEEPKAPELPADKKVMTIKVPPTYVPQAAGSFVCSMHRLPDVQESDRFHVIHTKVDVDYSSRNPSTQTGLFHHVSIHKCKKKPHSWMKDGGIFPCQYRMQDCQENFGNQNAMYNGYYTPEGVGIPIGGEGGIWVAVERHFYNSMGKAGVADTGPTFKITYTPTLRPKVQRELNIVNTKINVPAKTYGYVHQSWCPSSCTSRMGEETQIEGVAFHAHGNARKATLRVIRDGKELDPIAVVDPWDQSMATFPVSRTIKAGDSLLLECHYDNDRDTEITWGDNSDQEMCVVMVTLVGETTMTTCNDMPGGLLQQGQKPPAVCFQNGKLRTEPAQYYGFCNYSIPRTYCPDDEHKEGLAQLPDTSKERGAFKPFAAKTECSGGGGPLVPAVPGKCPSPSLLQNGARALPQSDRTDESADSMMAADADALSITGERDCGLGDRKFKLSWKTDCAEKKVTFEMETYGAYYGWMAVGLIDAGTADNMLRTPATKMMNADMVMVNGNSRLKDAWGTGYVVPRNKAKGSVTLDKVSKVGGKLMATFSRPFDVSEGVSFKEDGFLYMICAIGGSSDMDAKHYQAHMNPTPFSLFGGIPASGGGGASPNPAPEPEPKSEEPEPEPESEEPEPEPESEEPEPEPESEEPEPEPESEEPEPEPESEEPEPEPESEEPEPEPESEEPEPEPESEEPEPKPTPAPPAKGCELCAAPKVIKGSTIAGWSGGSSYSCQGAEDWLNSGSATATCSQGRSWWGWKCCKTGAPAATPKPAPATPKPTPPPPPPATPKPAPPPATPKPAPAPAPAPATGCELCAAPKVIEGSTTAGWSGGGAYSCQDAEDWLNGDSATASCSQGRRWWGWKCCKTGAPAATPKPAPPPATPKPAPAPANPNPAPAPAPPTDCSFCASGYKLRKRRAAWKKAKKNGKKYTCEMAQKDQKAGTSGLSCDAAKAKYQSRCCKKKRR